MDTVIVKEHNLTIWMSEDGDARQRDAVHGGVKAYNDATRDDFRQARLPGQGKQPLDIYVMDADSVIVGGVTADLIWGWLLIDHFWLREDLRRKGLGARLLQWLEEAAIARGCAHAQLKTYSFQARGFYEKYGYCVVGQMDDFPPGGAFFWMRKDFGGDADA